MRTFSRRRMMVIPGSLLLVGLVVLTGCGLPSARSTVPAFPVFPPLRHGVKAVFGPNGNDCGGDLQGRGRQLVEGFHDLGIDLTRIEFKWAVVEATRGTYDWSELDRLIGFLHRHGIEPMLMVYCAPPWAMRGTPADEQLFIQRGEQNLYTVVWPRREFLPDFERFCETAARRYRGQARLFEFWNEPDGMAGPIVYHDRAGKAVDVRYGGDAKEYTLWLQHMYAAVRRGNPDAIVAAGSLCVHDTQFIEAMYAAGCRERCDAISLHPYAKDGINVAWIEQCRRVMTAYGDWTKPVWLSEFGWDLGGEYDETTGHWPSSATRQAEIITATAPVIQSLPYITHAFWFTLNDWNTSQTGIDPIGTHRFGVMDLAGRRRPGFHALGTVVFKTHRLPRPAEMPLPQVVPPCRPIDADADYRINFAVNYRDPGPLLCPAGLEGKPGACRLLFRSSKLACVSAEMAVGGSGSRHGLPDATVIWTPVDGSFGMGVAAVAAGSTNAPPGAYEVVTSFGFGPETRFSIAVPAAARYVASPPKIDGSLSDWPSQWPIYDGRMKAAFAWDQTHLFFACAIHDPVHHQPHRGNDIWKGDCVQIAFDPQRDAVRGSRYDINDSEYALALTADGPVLWRYICPPDSCELIPVRSVVDQPKGCATAVSAVSAPRALLTEQWHTSRPDGLYVGQVEGAAVAVHRYGENTLFEAAIPWSELGVADPADGRLIGTAIAGCDWNGEKRTLYRFGDGLIGTKEPYRFASIRLVRAPSNEK